MPYPERGVSGLLRGDDSTQAVMSDRETGPLPAGTSLRADPAHAGAILEAALDAVITIDHHGRVLEFNLAAERTFGYTKQDVLGRELAGLTRSRVPPA